MHALKPMNELQQEIFDMCLQYLYAHENPQQMIKNSSLFKEGYDAFGLSDNEQRELRDMVLDRYNPSPREIADLGHIFFSTHKYEFGLLAVQLIKKHRPRMDRYVYEAVFKWLEEGVENSALADILSNKITPVFLELGIASLDDFETWRTASSKWTRRTAALTMLYLMDKASPERLLEYIKPLLNDEDKDVQYGVGFFLRELWGMHSEEVEAFLIKHKDGAAPMVLHLASQKMSIDKKKQLGRNAMAKTGKSFRSTPSKHKPQRQTHQPRQKSQRQPGNRKPVQKWSKSTQPQQRRDFHKKGRPNVVEKEMPEIHADNIPDWDSFDDTY
ncbi:MAG: DNA alkylation repair protein [Candidatus Cloacimonetes bacterium]|nr:DNA alkylation repair protein [Candidatus Cloacimonadota bacterium]